MSPFSICEMKIHRWNGKGDEMMKRKHTFKLVVLLGVIFLLSVGLGIVIYQLYKREEKNTYADLVKSETENLNMGREFAEKIEIQFIEIDENSQTAKILVRFPELKEMVKKDGQSKRKKSVFKELFHKTEYTEAMLTVEVEKKKNKWQIISQEIIDEFIINNINEGFGLIAE